MNRSAASTSPQPSGATAATFPTRPLPRRQPAGRRGAGRRASSAPTWPARSSPWSRSSRPARYAAVAVARAVVADALQRQAMSSSQPAGDRAHHRAEANRTACATLPLPAAQALCACGQQVSATSNPYRLLNLSRLLPAHTVYALAVNRTLGMAVSEGLLNVARALVSLQRTVLPGKARAGSQAGAAPAWPWPGSAAASR